MLLLEGMESLALLFPLLYRQLQFVLGCLGDILFVCLQLVLACNLVVQVLSPRHEISNATNNNFCQFSVNRPSVGVNVISSRGDR